VSGNLVRVVADRDRCVGAGQCVLSAPDVFDQSDRDGRVLILPDAVPLRPGGPLVDEDVARSAVDLCPSRALSLARP